MAQEKVLVTGGAGFIGSHLVTELIADGHTAQPSVNPANPRVSRLKAPGKTATLCCLASHVTVGNEILASYVRSRSPTVSIVPTTIDTNVWFARARRTPGPVDRRASQAPKHGNG